MSRRRIEKAPPRVFRARRQRYPIPLKDPEMAAIAEQSAVGMLQVIFDDALGVMRNAEYHPDARLYAKRIAKNILIWNGGAGPIRFTGEDMADINDKLRISEVK